MNLFTVFPWISIGVGVLQPEAKNWSSIPDAEPDYDEPVFDDHIQREIDYAEHKHHEGRVAHKKVTKSKRVEKGVYEFQGTTVIGSNVNKVRRTLSISPWIPIR